MCPVTWLRPNLAWSMDDWRRSEAVTVGTPHLHNLIDLCSRYRLPPLASSSMAYGEEVAGRLHHLFDRFDPPLFCKRDNGAIEHTRGEFKRYLSREEAHYPGRIAGGVQTVARKKRVDQNREGRKSVTQFFPGNCAIISDAAQDFAGAIFIAK